MNEDSLLVLNCVENFLPAFGTKLKNVRGIFNQHEKEIPEIWIQPPTPKSKKNHSLQIDKMLSKSFENFQNVLKRQSDFFSINVLHDKKKAKGDDEIKLEEEKLVKTRSLGYLGGMDYLQVPGHKNRRHSMPCLSQLPNHKLKQY
nr:uncharacterized protein LOC124805871 [Hydra vulgaris]